MIVGKTSAGSLAAELGADTKRVARFAVPSPVRAAKLSAFMDGLGSGAGPQAVRGVIYDAAGALVAEGDEVWVEDGQEAAWVDLPFESTKGGVELDAATYDFGVLGGGAGKTIRLYGDDPGSAALVTTLPLGASGGEITNATRAAGADGDGRNYVQVTNLLRNGSFETDLNNVGLNGVTATQDGTHVRSGTVAAKTVATGSGNVGLYGRYQTSGGFGTAGRVPALPLAVYTASLWVFPLADTTFAPVIEWYRDAGDGAGNTRSAITSSTSGGSQLARANRWTRIWVTALAPSDAAGCTPTFYAVVPGVGATWWNDEAQLELGYVRHDAVPTTVAPATQTQREQYANLLANPSFEDTTYAQWWYDRGSGSTLTRDTSQFHSGGASLHVQRAGGTATVSSAPGVFVPAGTPLTASAWVKGAAGQMVRIGYNERTAADGQVQDVDGPLVALTGDWQRLSVTATPAAANTKARVIVTGDASAVDYYVDDVMLEAGSTLHGYTDDHDCTPLESSVGAYGSATNLLANPDFETDASGWTYGGVPTSLAAVARDTSASRFGGASLRSYGIPAQQLAVGAGTITDAIRAAAVQGDGRGYQYVYNLSPNSSFEVNTNYWYAAGGTHNNSIARDTTYAKFGSASLKHTQTAESVDGFVAGGSNTYTGLAEGANAIPVQPGQVYTFSAWLKIPVALTGTNPNVRLRMIEWASDGVTVVRDSNLTVATTNVLDWTRFSFTLTMQATTAKVSLRFVVNQAVGSVWWDGAMFEAGAVAHDVVPTTVAPAGQVQGPLVTNLVSNGGFEADTGGGWFASTLGGAPSIARYTGDFVNGSASLRLLSGTTGTLNSARFPLTALAPNTTYTASCWAKVAAGAGATSVVFTVVHDNPQHTNSVAIPTDGQWHRISFTFTTDATSQASTYADIRVTGTPTTQYDIRVDGVQVETGGVLNTYVDTNGARASSAVGVADTSMGVYPGSNNVVANGGFETDASGWSVLGSTVLARVLELAKFGVACGRVVTPGVSTSEGVFYLPAAGTAAAGQVWTASAWVKGPPGAQLEVQAIARDSGSTNLLTVTTAFVATGDWQRVQATITTPASTSRVAVTVYTAGAAAQALVYWVDGVQVEQTPAATPYINTSGAAAGRVAGRLQSHAQNSIIRSDSGWVAFRVRMNFPSSQIGALTSVASIRMFELLLDQQNRLLVVLNSGGAFSCLRQTTGTEAGATTAGMTWSEGDYFTVVAKWDAANVYISVNGANFIQAADASIPALGNVAYADWGSDTGSGDFAYSDFLWIMGGTASDTGDAKALPSNADAATLYALGNTDPTDASVPAAGTNFAASLATSAYTIYRKAWPFTRLQPGYAATAGLAYTFSTWVLAPAGQSMSIAVRRADFSTSLGQTNFVATGSWQRVEVNVTAAATELIYPFIYASATLHGGSFWTDGMMLENSHFGHPFTPAFRGQAAITAPASLLDVTQAWVAFRFRVAWGNANEPSGGTGFPDLFRWTSGANPNKIEVYYSEGSNWFALERNGGDQSASAHILRAINAGDEITVVASWYLGGHKLSVDGGPFAAVAKAQVSAGLQDTFQLANVLNGEVLWAAGGLGIPDDDDAAALEAVGSSDPAWADLPALPTFLWTASDLNYIYTQTGKQNANAYVNGASNPFGGATPLDEDLSLFATAFRVYAPSPAEPDDLLARLPFPEAQVQLAFGAAKQPVPFELGWDWRLPAAVAVARQGGPAEGFLSQRVLVGLPDKPGSLIVFVESLTSDPQAPDLAVSRRAIRELGLPPSVSTIDARAWPPDRQPS